jgi:chromosome segregation protein
MRLKSLELVGFKSFLDPTVISFPPGITAVVGPNGCGKSNVVDAIRWVLGEQAPTRLRGKSTEDLIYAGNDSNPAAGMAEVSLTLEADGESVLPEPFSALSEICVTRRVYRSGDSEYLLNRIACRLKDITELFMAAQIHSRGYALIEQGRIEEIIQARPAELRALVEEAAGLSLFKGRREMSERKLERVKENLARLDDVVSEIDRQLDFARRQAKKAEAYRLVRQELDELERLSAARRLLEQRTELGHHRAREAALKDGIETARRQLAELHARTQTLASGLQARRDQAASAARELENLRAGFHERARTRQFLERRLTVIDEIRPTLINRQRELEEKAVAARAARAFTGARIARAKNDDDGGEQALTALRSRHDEATAALSGLEAGAEELRDEVSDLAHEAAVLRSRLQDLSAEAAELEQRSRRVEQTFSELEAASSQISERLHAADQQDEQARAGANPFPCSAYLKLRQTACASDMRPRILLPALGLAAVLALGIGLALSRFSLSALDDPSPWETYAATKAKRWLVSRDARGSLPSPPPNDAISFAIGDMQFGARCASCHGADGRTPSDAGRWMYPRASDLGTAAVQQWSDAELFRIIKHGIRFTGMPGFGKTLSDEDVWHLVRYVRRIGARRKG